MRYHGNSRGAHEIPKIQTLNQKIPELSGIFVV